jgi:RHS repeat-associated protein
MQSLRETLHCHYRYDALDRLIANERPSEPERQRFYCKSRLATEIQGANRYSMFQHGDQLLAQQQREGDVLDATLLATDQQRSVLHALKGNQPRQSIAYSPYGHRPAENGLLSLLGFNGERPDPVTGHYLLGNGNRAFNPVLMRFNSPDNLSPFGKGGLNTYAYCLGDPINLYDPSGNFSLSKFFSNMRARISSSFTRTGHSNNIKLQQEHAQEHQKDINAIEQMNERIDINTRDDRGVWKTSKKNQTLQELSYSNMPPQNIKKLPQSLRNKIEIGEDRANMYNHFSELAHDLEQQRNMSKGDAMKLSYRLTTERAKRGELIGVDPDKAATLIRTGYFV